jgi:hypothetical protein
MKRTSLVAEWYYKLNFSFVLFLLLQKKYEKKEAFYEEFPGITPGNRTQNSASAPSGGFLDLEVLCAYSSVKGVLL